MSNKPIVLTFKHFGKTVTIENESQVSHPGEVMEMFKDIFISTFGEDNWESALEKQWDKVIGKLNYTRINP